MRQFYSVIGTPFYLMNYVPGRVMKDPSLPGLQPSERKIAIAEIGVVPFHLFPLEIVLSFSLPFGIAVILQAVYEEMCRVLAAIHSVNVADAQLADFGKQGRLGGRFFLLAISSRDLFDESG